MKADLSSLNIGPTKYHEGGKPNRTRLPRYSNVPSSFMKDATQNTIPLLLE